MRLAAILASAVVAATPVRGALIETYGGSLDTDLARPLLEALAPDLPSALRVLEDALQTGDLHRIERLVPRAREAFGADPRLTALEAIVLAGSQNLDEAETLARRALEAPQPHAHAHAHVALAMVLRGRGEWDAAEKACRQALELAPDDAYAWNVLGRIQFDAQRYPKALDSFRRAIDLSPTFQAAVLNAGGAAYVLGDQAVAIAAFQRALDLAPSSDEALYGLALAKRETGAFEEAFEAMRRSVELEPSRSEAVLALGDLQLRTRRYEDAARSGRLLIERGVAQGRLIAADALLHLDRHAEADEQLAQAPDSAPRSYLLGTLEMVRGDLPAALARMEETLAKDASHAGAFVARETLRFRLGEPPLPAATAASDPLQVDPLLAYLRGNERAAAGRWPEAIEQWRAAEGIDGAFAVTGLDAASLADTDGGDSLRHSALGALLFLRHLFESAEREFAEALEAAPRSVLAHYWMGQVRRVRGDGKGAIEHFEATRAEAPRFLPVLSMLGDLYMGEARPQEAALRYRAAIDLKDHAGLRLRLGLAYEAQDQLDDAAREYRKVVELAPELHVGYNQLAWLYARQGIKLDEALALVLRAQELRPDNAAILDTLGWIRFQQGRNDEALTHLARAAEIQPRNPSILYRLARVQQVAGDVEASWKTVQAALGASEEFDEVAQARVLAEQLERERGSQARDRPRATFDRPRE